MPLLWIVLGIAGFAYWWRVSHRYPAINPTADALTLLNFPAYSLQSGRETYTYFLSPEGLTSAQAQSSLGGSVTIARRHIPLPGPSSVPAFMDLWAAQSTYTGPPRTVSPSSVLQEQGVPALAANVDPSRQLGAILYAAALNPTTSAKLVFIPIAAKQV